MAKKPSRADRAKPSTGRAWAIHFFKRHVDDDASESVPGRDFLESCPPTITAQMFAVLKAVAEAPPPMFSGGGKWEAMHDEMKGFYEIRIDGGGREHFRLFCLLDRNGESVGLGGPSIVIIAGARKRFRTTLARREYRAIQSLGTEFRSRTPRSVMP